MFLEDDLSNSLHGKVNILAVIQAYRDGTLKMEPGYTSYWYNGEMIRPLHPRDPPDLEIETVRSYFEFGKGRVWVEVLEVHSVCANDTEKSVHPPAIVNDSGIPTITLENVFVP